MKYCSNKCFLVDKRINVKDYGDITYSVNENDVQNVPNMREYSHVAACNQQVSKHVANIIRDGRVCLTLGGDHSIGKKAQNIWGCLTQFSFRKRNKIKFCLLNKRI